MDDDVRLVELTDVIRRTLRSRTSDPHLIEDITQDAVLRVAVAQPQLEPEALRAYAIVTARNGLMAHHRKQSVASRHAHRVVDYTTLDGAEELTLEREETDALAQALDTLADGDRRLLLDHEVDGVGVAELADRHAASSGAIAMRLARARAVLRLEFLLSFRRVTLPTDRCRQVLLAISAGDQRRQLTLDASEHLIGCEACAQLSEPLVERRRGAAAWWFLPVPAWIARLGRKIRDSRPAQAVTALVIAVVVAATALAVPAGHGSTRSATPESSTSALLAPSTTTAAPPQASASAQPAETSPPTAAATSATAAPPAPAPPACPPLAAAFEAVPPPTCLYTLVGMAVVEVPANEGFWIRSTDGAPMWVHLVGHGESPQHVVAGETVTLHASVVAVTTPAAGGLPADQADRLAARPVFLAVRYQDLTIDGGASPAAPPVPTAGAPG